MKDLQKLLDLAITYADSGDDVKAIELYRQILIEKEDWSTIHYNLGLIYKYQSDWKKAFKHNARAAEIDPDHEASQWNLGIAATMLEEWKVARKCWNCFGMKYEESDEDPAQDIGMTPIRLDPNGESEVVWARRIDPARAVIKSIPFPESQRRYGDLVLNDGAPMGTRIYKGMEYSVFNELQILEKSDYITFSIKCDFKNKSNYDLLELNCHNQEIEIENWTTDVELLCKQCSEGTPHEKHEKEPVFMGKKMTIAFAGQSEDVLCDILNDWSYKTGIDFDEFYKY